MREDVHVSEAVYGQYRQVVGRLTQVVEGVGELGAVRRQEVDSTWGGNSSMCQHILYCIVLCFQIKESWKKHCN